MPEPYVRARRLWLGFLAAVIGLLAILAWLGWRIAAQDEQLAASRRTAAADNAADLAVAALERQVATVEQDLASLLQTGTPPRVPAETDDAVFVRIIAGSTTAWPGTHLAFVPDQPTDFVDPGPELAAVDTLQFVRHDYPAAIAMLRQLADGPSPDRAVYLARMAQNLLAIGQGDAALRAYQRLADLGDTLIAGVPAAVAGRLGMLRVHDADHDTRAAAALARDMDQDIAAGRWRLSAASYALLAREISQRVPQARIGQIAASRFAEQVARLSDACHSGRCAVTGRAGVEDDTHPMLLVWRASNKALAVYVADAAFVYRQGAGSMARVSLSTPAGHHVAGPNAAAGDHRAIRLAADTRLPWTLTAVPLVDAQELGGLRARRRLLAAGLSVMLALMLVCTVLVGRVVSHELAVSRLRSDFVSAVSHEFRTPLTTLCQLSELLERGRVPDEAARHSYYGYLRSESERLKRLVEGLLAFGRLQEGRASFRFEILDAAAFTRTCVAEFERAQTVAHRITVDVDADVPRVEADSDALRCALWNLLENAVKYSPADSVVRVGVRRDGARVAISVADSGFGVDPAERQRIFERFVRGRAAIERAIVGTGIGLATAREILRAHRGAIDVESDGASGSTFTLVLPGRT